MSAGTTACWSGRVSTMAPTTAAAAARTAGPTIHRRLRRAALAVQLDVADRGQGGLGGRGRGGGVTQAGAGVARPEVEVVHDEASFRASVSWRASVARARERWVLTAPSEQPEHGGDVGQRPVLHVEQGDRPALLLGQPANQPPQLGIGGGRHVAGGGRLADTLQRSRLPATAAADVRRGVEGDPPHPRTRPVQRCDPRPVLLGLRQRLLGEILGPLPVTRQGVEHRDESRVLVTEEALERHRPVTCCDHHLPSHTAPAWRVDTNAFFVSGRSRPLD